MKKSALSVLFVITTLSVSPVCAQTAVIATPRPTPPPGTLLERAADFSAWTIVQRRVPGLNGQPAEAAVRAAALTSAPDCVTSVMKTGQVRHQNQKVKDGGQQDTWYERGNRITMESMWKIPIFEGSVNGANTPLGPDFPDLSGISAPNFVGTQTQAGVAYLVFESQAPEGNPAQVKAPGYQPKPAFHRALINADTRLPWLVQTGDVLQVYAFQPAPTAVLNVPAEYQAMFDLYEKNKVLSSRRAAAP